MYLENSGAIEETLRLPYDLFTKSLEAVREGLQI